MNLDDAIKIVSEYSSSDLCKHGSIPPKKMENARQLYPVDPDDTPVALIDATVFGSAKCGMVIGLKGIYWRNDWTNPTDKNFLSWEELSSHADRMSSSFMKVTLAPGCVFDLSGSQMKSDPLIGLLRKLCIVNKKSSGNKSESAPSEEWHLAIDGEPIDRFVSQDAVDYIQRQGLDPGKVMAWKDGMEEWSPVTHIPELSSLMAQPKKASRNAPPPIPKAPGAGKATETATAGVQEKTAPAVAKEKISAETESAKPMLEKAAKPSSKSLLMGTHPDQLFMQIQSMNTVGNVFNFAMGILGDNGKNTEAAKDFQSYMVRALSAFRKQVVEKRGITEFSNDLATMEAIGVALATIITMMSGRRVPDALMEQLLLEGVRATLNIQGTVEESRGGMIAMRLAALYEETARENQQAIPLYMAMRLIGANLTGEINPDYDLDQLISAAGKDALLEKLMNNLMPGLDEFHKEAMFEANLLVGRVLDLFPARY